MVVDSKKAFVAAKQIFRGAHPQGELVSGFPIKAVAMDLDGSLLHSDRTLSAHTVATIKRVTELGILAHYRYRKKPRHPETDKECLVHQDTDHLLQWGLHRRRKTGEDLVHLTLDEEISRRIVRFSREYGVSLHSFMNYRFFFEPDSAEAERDAGEQPVHLHEGGLRSVAAAVVLEGDVYRKSVTNRKYPTSARAAIPRPSIHGSYVFQLLRNHEHPGEQTKWIVERSVTAARREPRRRSS
jgi:hypothetical protein